MDILSKKTDEELLQSLMAEVAKANNELRCSKADTEKAQNRLGFAIVLLNELRNRPHD